MNWYSGIIKKSLHEKYIPAVPKGNNLPFDDIFHGNLRIAIPIENEKIREIISRLETGSTNSRSIYQVDLKNQIAYRVVETHNGTKKIAIRLGKVIRKELGEEWANEFSRQMASENRGENSSEYTIIVSRSPLDIVRMSDHREWSSCHSPPGWNKTGVDYFQCAFEEASDGGPIAYIVRAKDYERIKDKLQDSEIFKDLDRDIDGVTPISRMRVNRYENNEDGTELAIPMGKIYGQRIAGFYDTMRSFFYGRQEDKIKQYDGQFDLDNWGRYGGSYKDMEDDSIFEDFFVGSDVSGRNADYIGQGEGNFANMWQLEINEHMEEARKLNYCGLWAEVEDNRIYATFNIHFIFPNINLEKLPRNAEYPGSIDTRTYFIDSDIREYESEIFSLELSMREGADTEENRALLQRLKRKIDKSKKRKDNAVSFRQISQELEDIIDKNSHFYVREMEIDLDGDSLRVTSNMTVEEMDNPDDFGSLVEEAKKWEESWYSKTYHLMYKILENNGYATTMEMETNLNASNFQHFSIEENDGIYTIKTEIGMVAVPQKFKKEIGEELYSLIFQYVKKIYDNVNQPYLFEVYRPMMERSRLPEPEIMIRDLIYTKDVPIPEKGDWYKETVRTPSNYATLDISFVIPFADFASYDSDALLNYLNQLDRNMDDILRIIQQGVHAIVQKYQTWENTQGTNIAKNWYKSIKIADIEQSPIDIGTNGFAELSNFAAYPFSIDGIQCGGMEGFLQSLKFSDPEEQKQVCALHGIKAKRKGKKSKWQQDQNLYWMGQTFSREGKEYQDLLDRAFQELFNQSPSFREALANTGDSNLTHSIGKSDPTLTVLTENEFIGRLYKLRKQLTEKENTELVEAKKKKRKNPSGKLDTQIFPNRKKLYHE